MPLPTDYLAQDSPRTKKRPVQEDEDALPKLSDEKTAGRAALAMWLSRNEVQREYEARWRVNEWRRSGLRNVRLRKSDSKGWYPWVPHHVEANPDSNQTMNQAASHCRKFVGIMLADPPAPDCQSSRGDDDAKDSAEFATRALISVQNDRHLNDQALIRRAYDLASTYGSGFIWYRFAPHLGERTPVQILAGVDSLFGRSAQTEDEAVTDPATGMAWPDYREVFVKPDGVLTIDVNEAEHRPVGLIQGRVLTGRNVRMFPHDAQHITEAYGVQIGYFETLGQCQREYPEGFRGLDPDELEEILSYRPDRWEWTVSDTKRRMIDRANSQKSERYLFKLVTYLLPDGDEFPEGLCHVQVGDGHTLAHEPWSAEVDHDDGTTERVSLPLPVTQYAQFKEGTDCPYNHALMEIMGPGFEARSKIVSEWMTWLSKLNNRKVFIPAHSPIRPEQLRQPGHNYIRMLPGGKPEYEDVPAFAADGRYFLDFATREGEVASGLGDVGQGLESPQVQSGRHAAAIVSQVHATLSDLRQSIIDGYLHGCRIQLALIRAFFSRPRRMAFVGEDGAFKEKTWTGSQIGADVEVFLKNGTLTMLTPVAKAQLAEHLFTLGVIDQIMLQELTFSHMGPIVGMQDDPYRNRIRRQIARFMQGPPPQWQPQYNQPPAPQPQPVIGPDGQPVVDPFTGAPQMQPAAPAPPPEQVMDDILAGIFRPYPVDDLPYVAQTRLREMSKAMSTSAFAILPQEWQFGLLQEFNRAQAAATGAQGGQEPGQPPMAQMSPAQMMSVQGPAAQPTAPLPTETQPM